MAIGQPQILLATFTVLSGAASLVLCFLARQSGRLHTVAPRWTTLHRAAHLWASLALLLYGVTLGWAASLLAIYVTQLFFAVMFSLAAFTTAFILQQRPQVTPEVLIVAVSVYTSLIFVLASDTVWAAITPLVVLVVVVLCNPTEYGRTKRRWAHLVMQALAAVLFGLTYLWCTPLELLSQPTGTTITTRFDFLWPIAQAVAAANMFAMYL